MFFLNRREVGVERLGFRGRTAPGGERFDADHANTPRLREGEREAGFQGIRRFRHARAVNPNMPARDQLGRQPARFEKPRAPEPLVEALSLGGGQLFLSFSPINA